MSRVLIIEDEPSYADALQVSLQREGFEVSIAEDGQTGLSRFREWAPDVVLLDLMLPGIQGLDVLRRIRDVSNVPVIVVSAKDAEADVVSALELGADDYLTKPYSVRELLARIGAASRRVLVTAGGEDTVAVGNAVLDVGRHQLILDGVPQDLPRKEFAVLHMLMEASGKVVTRERLFDEVWGYAWDGDSKTIDQHIRRLRRRLEQVERAPRIETVRGVGYRLAAAG